MLAEWDAAFGPVAEPTRAAAVAAFDELDATGAPRSATYAPAPNGD
jgi:hypothetical protein